MLYWHQRVISCCLSVCYLSFQVRSCSYYGESYNSSANSWFIVAEWLWWQSITLFEERITKNIYKRENLERAALEKWHCQIISDVSSEMPWVCWYWRGTKYTLLASFLYWCWFMRFWDDNQWWLISSGDFWRIQHAVYASSIFIFLQLFVVVGLRLLCVLRYETILFLTYFWVPFTLFALSIDSIWLSWLQHRKHLCECKSSKLRLLYRHSLAELNALMLAVDSYCSEEATHNRNIRRQITCSNELSTLTKKVCLLIVCRLLESNEFLVQAIYNLELF